MRYRRFGSTELTVSEVGFGCARIGGVFHGSSRTEVVALLRRALDAGITFFDTADLYTQGESERLIGDAFRYDRQRVVVASKFGYRLPKQKQLISHIKPFVRPLVTRLGLKARQVHAGLRGTVSEQDFSPAYIARAAEATLRRLKTDYIDLYQVHEPPLSALQQGEFVEALERLQQQGKIRYWGVACARVEDAIPCFAHPSLASIQVGLSVLEQAGLDAAIPGAAQRGVAVIARQVFASGLLTRQFEALTLEELDNDPDAAMRKHEQLAAFGSIVERCGRNRAELALQFALAKPDVSVVLLGMSRQAQLEASLTALGASELSAEEQQLLSGSRASGSLRQASSEQPT